MTVEETRALILTSDDFVLSEFFKLQELFKMKKVIRYHHERTEVIDTESVAEHVYGMFVLINYFLPLEDTQKQWDYETIVKTACYHDIDEIETGDTIGYLKTDADRAQEFGAQERVIAKLPEMLQEGVTELLKLYEHKTTPEAAFTKAIDKMEPFYHLINENGKKVIHENKTTAAQNASIKDQYVAGFPYISRFNQVLKQYMIANGFFYSDTITQ
jgi:5'-deoxynucleotidase YfbR-like HD superfamily hydrolase